MRTVKYLGITVCPGRPEKHERTHIRYTDPTTGKRRTKALPDLSGDALHRWLLGESAALLAARAAYVAPPVAVPLDLLVEKYLRERHRLRPGTLKQYRYSLESFARFVMSRPITRPLLRLYRASLDQPGVAAATVNRDLAHVSAFLNYARAAGDIALARDEISDGLKRLPSDAEKKEPLTVDEIRRLVLCLDRAVAASLTSSSGQAPQHALTSIRYRAFVLAVLLTGMRASECLTLRPEQVQGDRVILDRHTKTKRGRVIDLSVSPLCPLVTDSFSGWTLTHDQVRSMREKLHPWATFQRLRVTCGTYLTCAPGIYSGASAYMSAARLGHSVAIAEKHYVGVVRVDPSARTLEQAMGIDDLIGPADASPHG